MVYYGLYGIAFLALILWVSIQNSAMTISSLMATLILISNTVGLFMVKKKTKSRRYIIHLFVGHCFAFDWTGQNSSKSLASFSKAYYVEALHVEY